MQGRLWHQRTRHLCVKEDAAVATATRSPAAQRETAETMAGKQKEIAVSEFFAKNRHLLGFDNPRKALLTTVKEAVDNSLDACEEGQILPELWIRIEALNGGSKSKADETQPTLPDAAPPSLANATRFKVMVRDNGPASSGRRSPMSLAACCTAVNFTAYA
jgi:DNA topoisomerase-6 subunit B